MTEAAMIEALTAAGYLVVKRPPCKLAGRGHGRHTLATRSILCEGEGPIPHGFSSTHLGLLGFWNHCQCGHDFADYEVDENGRNPWLEHVNTHAPEPVPADERTP